eukprot:EG_transcript_11732
MSAPASTFPDLSAFQEEKATKRWYDWAAKDWHTAPITIRISGQPFAQGDTYIVHHALLHDTDGAEHQCVVKKSKDHFVARSYEARVMMQAVCQAVALAFNARRPPKEVTFAECFMIQRVNGTWWQMEAFLPGKYVQHNDATGFVAKGSRNTPQAFSHFSYEFTERRMMIVDVQGVDDCYTDPQVLTVDGQGYGAGNTGEKGIQKFLDAHWCNRLCSCLGLPFVSPKKFGMKLHKNPKEGGTTLDLADYGETESMRVSEFVGTLRPATTEELSILGLSTEQYGALLTAFLPYEKNHFGYMEKDQLLSFFQDVRRAAGLGVAQNEFLDFQERAAKEADKLGRVTFRSVVLAWTDNE